MSEEEAKNEVVGAEEEADAGEEKTSFIGGLLGKAKVGGIIAVIVLSECAAAYLLFPSAEEVEAMARGEAANRDETLDPESDQEGKDDSEPMAEVDLGDFTVTSYQPGSNITLRIDFRLFGTVYEKDRTRFETQFASTEQRLRDKVIVTARNSDVDDLTDASLGLLKRRMVETINKTLGGSLIREVGFGDFSFLEQ